MTTLHDDLTRADELASRARSDPSAARPSGSVVRGKRAALYVRQSKSDDQGIDRQIERTSALASLRGWSVAGTYIDDDVSASKARGPQTAWGRMLADRAAGLIDVVIGVDLDRVVRSTRDLNVLIEAGLALVTLDGEIDLTTADGEFRASMLAALARFEVRRKGERQSRANAQRAARGGVPKGQRLFGYTTAGEVVPEEAEQVRAMFDGFSRGDALRTLAARHGSTPSSIRDRLMNPRYCGRRSYKGEVVSEAGAWEPIVEGAMFDVVAARLTDPRRKTNTSGTTKRKHLGSGIFRCECGDSRPVVSGGTGDRYRCNGCGLSRTREHVDSYVVATLLARLSQPDALAAMKAQPADVSGLLAQESAIKTRLGRLATLVADGTLSDDDVRAAAEPLRARLADVQRRVAESTRPAVVATLEGAEGRLAELWETLSNDRRRALIHAFAVVTLRRQTRARGFRPESVSVAWRC